MRSYGGQKTIREIAEEAEVSVATVSRYLNNKEQVSSKTQDKIKIIIERYSYKPNQIAKHLSLQKTETFGLVLPDITNPFFAEISRTIEQAALDKGHAVMICNTMNHIDLEQRYLSDLTARRVDGIIMLGGSANEVDLTPQLAENIKQVIGDLPLVLIDGQLADIPSGRVIQNIEFGLTELFEYLFGLGHKRISFMGGLENVSTFVDKANIYRLLMTKHACEEFIQVLPSGFSFQDGYESMMKFIRSGSELPTAIIGVNDIFAGGVIRACHEAGIRIPADLSVSGFDNTEFCEMMNPTLTSLGIDYRNLGQQAVSVLLGDKNNELKVLDMQLIRRDSTGPNRV